MIARGFSRASGGDVPPSRPAPIGGGVHPAVAAGLPADSALSAADSRRAASSATGVSSSRSGDGDHDMRVEHLDDGPAVAAIADDHVARPVSYTHLTLQTNREE